MPNPVVLDDTLALIDEEEYLIYKQTAPGNPATNTDWITAAINWLSAEIKRYCSDRIFIIPTNQLEEIFQGDGTESYSTLSAPITDTPSIWEWDGDSWQELLVASYGREVEAAKGKIWFHNGFTFVDDVKYKIKYKPGWTRANVPHDLKGVCKFGVHRLALLAGGKEGIASESFADTTVSYNLGQLLGGKETSILDSYKRRFL